MSRTERAAAAAEAREMLRGALVDLAAVGRQPRCAEPVNGSNPWLSDDFAERRTAAHWCTGCPVLAQCGEVGQYEKAAVYGGRDRTDQRSTP